MGLPVDDRRMTVDYIKENMILECIKPLDKNGQCRLKYCFEDTRAYHMRGNYVDLSPRSVTIVLVDSFVDDSHGRPVACNYRKVLLEGASSKDLFQFCAHFGWDLFSYNKDVAKRTIMHAIKNVSGFKFDDLYHCRPLQAANPCQFPNCGKECEFGSVCCEIADHKRFSFFTLHERYYRSNSVQFGEVLMSICADQFLLENRNKLQAASNQLGLLNGVIHHKSTCLEIYELYRPYIHLLACFIAESQSIVFPGNGWLPFIKDTDSKVANQTARADAILKELKGNDGELLFMDGHGFILLKILDGMYKAGMRNNQRLLKRIHIHWADIVGTVNDWHAALFPCNNIIIHRSDVFAVARELLQRNSVSPDVLLLYLNFCGFSAAFEAFLRFVSDYSLSVPPHFLSFSVARTASEVEGNLVKRLRENRINFQKVEVHMVQRYDFVTYYFPGHRAAVNRGTISSSNGVTAAAAAIPVLETILSPEAVASA
jgi:hypothetical protein